MAGGAQPPSFASDLLMGAPQVGSPLPRAADAYVESGKWHGYVVAEDGHGPHWSRIFRYEAGQAESLREAILLVARDEPVTEVRHGPHGVGCSIRAELTFNGRTAIVLLAWFYDTPDAAPRLVSAYPSP